MAKEFVTLRALRTLATGSVWTDDWSDPDLPESAHIAIAEISECFAVFPATLNITMKLAQGLTDTPALMALQLTKAPVVLASAFPGENEVITQHIETLKRRPNLALAEPVEAFSTGTGQWGRGQTGFFMPNVLQALERLRRTASA
jgi:phosphopantothenoylcysteine decarboxylase/phosphopantothenate--cysteine ligase